MMQADTENRIWILEDRPAGNAVSDFEAALKLREIDLPPLNEGEVRVRNQYLSMDAGTRMWMTAREDGYNPPLPLGGPMTGLALGRVEQSRHSAFAPGDLVRCFGNWADYSQVDAELSGMIKLNDNVGDIRDYFGVLGMNGWTALWGITETGQAKSGETVLVSAAAGSTGILAAQIAKNLGCRVIGLAGGPVKCRWLEGELGLDKAIDYKTGNIAEALAAEEKGIDLYFDNVAGPILDDVLPNMALYGRIALCGVMAQYAADGSSIGPANFDQILMKRLRVEGFFSPDFMDQGERLTTQLKIWLDAGKLHMPFDETQGVENTLTAYARLFSGANIGKVIVKLS